MAVASATIMGNKIISQEVVFEMPKAMEVGLLFSIALTAVPVVVGTGLPRSSIAAEGRRDGDHVGSSVGSSVGMLGGNSVVGCKEGQ